MPAPSRKETSNAPLLPRDPVRPVLVLRSQFADSVKRLTVWRWKVKTSQGWTTKIVVTPPEEPPPHPDAEHLADVDEVTAAAFLDGPGQDEHPHLPRVG